MRLIVSGGKRLATGGVTRSLLFYRVVSLTGTSRERREFKS